MTPWKDRSQKGVEVESEANFHISNMITVEAVLLKVGQWPKAAGMAYLHDHSEPRPPLP